MPNQTVTIEYNDDPIMLSFDENNLNWSPEWEYNSLFLKAQMNYAHHWLQHKGYLFLNDLLWNLGFAEVPQGQLLGWTKETESNIAAEITFDHTNPMGPIIIVITPDGLIYDKI